MQRDSERVQRLNDRFGGIKRITSQRIRQE